MPLVADRVKETTTTAGTGTLTLAGAATGFQSFSAAFGTGAVVYYVIAAGADWEIGIGTTGSGTLSRDTVLQSSNGDALVDWPAGTKDVFCAYVADRAVTTSDPATLTNKTIDSVTNFVGANQLHLKAKATENLAKGDVCKVTGFNAGENAIEVAKVSSPSDIAIGATDAVINIGDIGTVVNTGTIEGLNTNAYAIGTILYPNTSGGFTSSKPASGQYQACAFVLRQQSVNGVVYVEFTNPQYVEVATNTANTLVLRDGSGNFAAGTVTAALTGNASTATALSSSRTFALTGDVTGSVSSDLTSGASISTAIAAGVIVDADINASAAIADTKLATISTAGKVSNSATTATANNTASTIVARDASGNFTAGTITATLSGAAPAGSLSGSTLASGVTASSLTSVGTLTSLTMGGTLALADNQITRPRFTDYAETYTTPSISAGTLTLNIENGNVFRVSRNANITTLTISNPAGTGNACSFTLIFDANGTSYTITWPASVKWPGGTAPTITTTASRSDMFVFYTNNAGTTWYAMTAAQNFVTT